MLKCVIYVNFILFENNKLATDLCQPAALNDRARKIVELLSERLEARRAEMAEPRRSDKK